MSETASSAATAVLAKVLSAANRHAELADQAVTSTGSEYDLLTASLSPEQLARAKPLLEAFSTSEKVARETGDEELLSRIAIERDRLLQTVLELDETGNWR